MTLSLDTAYRSFGGEVEASSTPTICRLPDSRRHQLWAIAHRNQRAERVKSQQWFYNFCLRLLLERVTHFCYEHAKSDNATDRLLKIVYSERGGHSYGQTIAYHELLKNQDTAAALVLTTRRIFWH